MAAEDFRPESIASTAFFTGHRILGRDELVLLPEALFRCLQEAYTDGYRRFFCGCALGFDTLAAFQVIRLRVQLCPGENICRNCRRGGSLCAGCNGDGLS